ncbi:MAG TPA: hypothetical protein VFG03_06540 [Telluria sp.]|nr:hypothetical protein [Telluria sp.]
MIAPAGSALWLLRHEVKLFLYGAGFGGRRGTGKRRSNKLNILVWLAAAALLHGFAFAIVAGVERHGAPPQQLIMVATGILAAALPMMLSSGLKASVEVLFTRGDLDLLLSSPLPSRSIFTVRLAGITVGIAGVYLFFLSPLAHVGLVLGQFHWLAIYPGVLSMAAVTAALAMLLTLGLVRLLGVRRTRVVAQVLGALSGALLFLVSQLYSTTLRGLTDRAANWLAPLLAPGAPLGPDSMLWLPGHALLGAPGPLLLLSLASLAAFLLTVHFTHGFFVHGVQQAVSAVRATQAPAGGMRFDFGRSLARTVMVKEWRLIARDPQLISQVLLQLLYLLPMCALLFVKGPDSLPGLASALAFLCASLTASLAWIIISAEDAPDLLLAAPCSQRTIQRAKLAAVALPPLLVVALPLLWIALRHPLAGMLASLVVTAAVASAALIVLWCGRPSARSDFKVRAKGNFFSNLLETLNAAAWAGFGFLLLSSIDSMARAMPLLLGAAGAFAAALLMLLVAWLARTRAG